MLNKCSIAVTVLVVAVHPQNCLWCLISQVLQMQCPLKVLKSRKIEWRGGVLLIYHKSRSCCQTKREMLKHSMTPKGIQYSTLQSERLIKATSSEKTNSPIPPVQTLFKNERSLGNVNDKTPLRLRIGAAFSPDLASLKCINGFCHLFF